jgi:hypothetical protein
MMDIGRCMLHIITLCSCFTKSILVDSEEFFLYFCHRVCCTCFLMPIIDLQSCLVFGILSTTESSQGKVLQLSICVYIVGRFGSTFSKGEAFVADSSTLICNKVKT